MTLAKEQQKVIGQFLIPDVDYTIGFILVRCADYRFHRIDILVDWLFLGVI